MLIVFAAGCCATISEYNEGVTVVVSGSEVVQVSLSNETPVEVMEVNTSGWYMSGSFDPVRPDKSTWVCYDYSIDYSRNHPEWKIVTMSGNSGFRGVSHMVNYKMVGDFMLIHDEMYGNNLYFRYDRRTTDNPYYEEAYYHFYDVNETPLRMYMYMADNSETFFAGS
jgi:hypothetical protein